MRFQRSLIAIILSLGLLMTVLALIGSGYAAIVQAASAMSPTLAPQPINVTPTVNAVGVPLTINLSISFDEPIDLMSVTTRTFVVHGSQSPIFTGTYSVGDLSHTVTLNPSRSFFPGEVVRAVVMTGTLNITGAQMLTPTQWQFTAGPVAPRCVGGFTQNTAVLSDVAYSGVAWGDYDNDGHLDILGTGAMDGSRVTQVWHNSGDGSFTLVPISLNGGDLSSVAWGDYDNDGRLDILFTGGYFGHPDHTITELWHNDGNGVFTLIPTSLPNVWGGNATWGDYDNDGYLDILIAGGTGSNFVTEVWHNGGDGTFTLVPTSFPGIADGKVAWGDYDNDGGLDILLSGYLSSAGRGTQLWHNNGNGTFTLVPTSLPDVTYSRIAWGDYDNDERLDILLAGWAGETGSYAYITQVWHNNGNGTFTLVPTSLPGVVYSSVAWGDYDNDGDLDILLAGDTGTSLVTQVWRNDGAGVFALFPNSLTGVAGSNATWGDYDNDGDLDILLAGSTGPDYVTQLWHNDDCAYKIYVPMIMQD